MAKTPYTPDKRILEKYANVLVNFALGSGAGIKKGETVRIIIEESAKPILIELQKAILKAGGNFILNYLPDDTDEYNFSKIFYELASDIQITYFPKNQLIGMVKDIDHQIVIISEAMKNPLAGVDPKKMMKRGEASKFFMDLRNHKENLGKFTWTLALYGTPAMAKEAKMSEKDYWQEIINACYLDNPNPIKKWKDTYKKMAVYQDKLNKLSIDKLHVEGADADLWIKLSPMSKWIGGSGRNIPSFELFTSPDWRGTSGWIRFNQPLYRYGNLIDGIELWFENGRVVKCKARSNENVLREMIATKNADKIGEYSLTDSRFSEITKFMAETLYDENIGGRYGNTHLALGKSYHDCYKGDPSKVTKKGWEKLGYNDSSVHTDIISTTDRTVTAYLPNGKTKVIYKDGKFTL